jgi:hypothetical protein
MHQYDRFIFESYDFDINSRTIALRYSLDEQVHFEEVIDLPKDLNLNSTHPDLNAALFALHLAGGASYYKTYCPKTIEVKSGKLTPDQAKYWNALYTHGLGEFFYRNHLDFHDLIHFPGSTDVLPNRPITGAPKPLKRVLVAFGGGKDSIVTAQLLKKTNLDLTLFRVRHHRLITELANRSDLPLLEIQRTLAKELFTLNENGAYNGHVPVTAYIAFLSIVISLLGSFDGVVFSNERSSSYGNIDYLGMAVNHQWSKSQAAEELLENYIGRYITGKVSYLNIVRPLSELHIAKLFSSWPEYFPLATSCNRNWLLSDHDNHANPWCGVCPKCAFTFALLAAWLPEPTVKEIFGHNLFADTTLLPLYRQLWGREGFKPFECVGTPEETIGAFYLAMSKPGFKNTPAMTEFIADVLPTVVDPTHTIEVLLTPELNAATSHSRQLLRQTGAL